MGPLRHVAGDATGNSIRILRDLIDCSVEGGIIHLLMRMIRSQMATSAGLRISCLFQGKLMRGMAAVTPFLDDMASFTEGSPNFLRNGEVFSLNSHSFKPDRMAAFPELCQFFLVAFSAFFREDHGLLLRGDLVINV